MFAYSMGSVNGEAGGEKLKNTYVSRPTYAKWHYYVALGLNMSSDASRNFQWIYR